MSTADYTPYFDSVSSKAWKQKIQFELNGSDYNSLVWESIDPISVRPFYHFDEKIKNYLSKNKIENKSLICQTIYVTDVEKTAKNINKLKTTGVSAFYLIIPNITINCIDLLQKIAINNISLYIKPLFLDAAFCQSLNQFSLYPTIYILNDPVQHLTEDGNWFINKNTDFKTLQQINTQNKLSSCLSIRITEYQNAGASIIQQIAFGLAHLTEYFTEIETFASQIVFEVAVGENYFFEIAKLRALRILTELLAKEYSLTGDCHIISVPSKRNKTLFYTENNIVRTTTESMAAILGGTNSVLIQAPDFMFKKESIDSNRLALHQLLILENECDLNTNQPAEGSYFINYLTQQITDKALLLFKEIERKGGFLTLLNNGDIQKRITDSAKKQQELFDNQTEILVGANSHFNSNEISKSEFELYPFTKTKPRKTIIKPIVTSRLSEKLEKQV